MPEASMPTIKNHQSHWCAASQRMHEENTVRGNNSQIEKRQSQETTAIQKCCTRPGQSHYLKKTGSKQSKRRDQRLSDLL